MKGGNYYNKIASAYDELYQQEQIKKCKTIANYFDFKSKKIIDVGCGTGIATDFFKCKIGIDPSKEMLNIARKKFPKTKFIFGKAEDLPFRENEFDAVVSITAIQNFDNIEKGLNEIKRVGKEFVLTFLKKSGKRKKIDALIKKIFKIRKIIEEEKDMIYFCTK